MIETTGDGGAVGPRVSTGNAQADAVLGGGLPANSITIVMGQPGTGKTVFAEQLLFQNVNGGRPALYLTTLSEPLSRVITYLQRFDFFDESKLGSAVLYEDVGHDLATDGIGVLSSRVREAIQTISPKLLVIDSFKAVHDLSGSVAEMRRLISDLAGMLSAYDVTTLLVGEYADDDTATYPEFAVADGIIQLARRRTSRHDERYLRVLKLRGSAYHEGAHSFRVSAAGLEVHPRLVTPTVPADYVASASRATTGVQGLDPLLGGGLWAGSNALVVGAAGAGKTTFALSFALEGARRGEPSLYLNFQENPIQLARTIDALGADPPKLRQQGLIMRYASPVEMQIDSIIVDLFETIRDHGIRRVVIDSLNDIALAASDGERFHDYLYALVQHFVINGVTSVMTLDRAGRGPGSPDGLRVSSISDAIIELALDPQGPRRTLRVVKARATNHDLRAHEMVIRDDGVRVLHAVPV